MRNIRKQLVALIALLCVLCLSGNAMAGTLKLPSGLKVVEEEAFDGSGVTSVEIPEGTERIESKAFTNNASLTDVYLPKNDVAIAPDAFDSSSQLTFHVFLGTENANWVTDHGYKIAYISTGGDTPSGDVKHQISALIASEGTSALQDNKYGTGRLIVKLNSGAQLPDLEQYNPKQSISMGNNLYVIQFHNYNDARDCALSLEAWSGCKYVEADYFLSSADTGESSNGAKGRRTLLSNGAYNPSDPMGFSIYTNSLPDTVGNVTVAVIDNGVTASEVDCTVSAKSYDFVSDNYTLSGSTHGTTVANHLCNSFGSLKGHLTIISYNVENHSNSKISYLMMGLAILQAKEDGANFINVSIAGESSYSDEQDNEFLRECIALFGPSKIIAAGGNYASSVNNFIPAKYCTSVTGVKLSSDGTSLVRAGTATGADYGGYSTFTSYAAPMVTAAIALLWLDPDQSHTLSATLEPVEGDNAKMPILSRLAVKPVNEIIINDGEPVESIFEVGDRASIDYEVRPSDATDPQVNVTIEPSDGSVIEILYNESSRVRFRAAGPGTATMTFTSNDGNAQPVVVPLTIIQPVTSVRITGNTGETLMKDETLSLSTTVLPANASDKSVEWTSSNNSIATVSAEGVVSQVGTGTVTITATSKSNPLVYDSVTVSVSPIPAASSVTVSASGGIDTLYVGKTAGAVQMNASVLPDGADQTVTWSVDKPDIATIDSTGLLTAKADGEVIVTATSVSSGKKGYKGMTIIQWPTSITVSGASSVDVGSKIQLSATVSPTNARDKSVTWSSDDESIATVSQSGEVTGITAGSTIIFAISNADGTVVGRKSITVTVLPSSVSINTPSSTTMDIGGQLTLTATVSPSNASNKTLTWSTGDSSIATVSNGVVTAKAAGTVSITATTVNGKTNSITLTVRQPYTLSFNANGGSCSTASVTAYSGYQIGNVLPTPTWSYHTFLGWYTAASGGTKLTSSWSTTCSTTYTVYAHWSWDTCTVTYDANGGSCSTSTATVNKGAAIGTLPTPTRTYYSFDGWYTAASGGNKVSTTTTFTANTTLYAHWTRLKCTITYNANGGSCSTSSVTINQGDAIGTLATPTRSYYTFDAWYTAASGGTKIATTTTFTSNSTIYAHWTPNNYTYSIVYKSSNGTSLGSTTMTKAYGSSATVTPPAYAGYTTPSAQTVNWDSSSKTITFTYSPVSATVTSVSNVHFATYNSGEETYSAEITVGERTATSVQIKIKVTFRLPKGAYNAYAHKLTGKVGDTSIPKTTIVSLNKWASSSSSVRTESSTTSWISVPVTATQTTVNANLILRLYNSNDTYMSSYAHTEQNVTVTIPGY